MQPINDWSDDFFNGYKAAIEKLKEKFEKEYYLVATEDPYYAYYIKYTIEELDKELEALDGRD